MTTLVKFLPTINYSGFELTDISQRFVIAKIVKTDARLYQEYQIEGNESPEDIAQDFYKDPTLYWLIYLMNDIIDPFFGWLLSQEELEAFTIDKYSSGLLGTHHYELDDGTIVPMSHVGSVTITNIQHEDSINEKKRKIKIIRPDSVSDIKQLIRSGINVRS